MSNVVTPLMLSLAALLPATAANATGLHTSVHVTEVPTVAHGQFIAQQNNPNHGGTQHPAPTPPTAGHDAGHTGGAEGSCGAGSCSAAPGNNGGSGSGAGGSHGGTGSGGGAHGSPPAPTH